MKNLFFLFLWFFLSSLMLGMKVSAAAAEPKAILFLGNSLTAGYGVDATQAFPALILDRIDSLGWNFVVINAGQSGDTSSGGLSRIDWLLRHEFHVLFLELGINDGLRGIHVDVTRQNLQAIINRTKSRYPDVKVVLAGMRVPPNMGEKYAASFRDIFPRLAKKNGAHLIPFLLEGVGGDPDLNLPDGVHPSVEGHKIVAENVWKVMEPLLRLMK